MKKIMAIMAAALSCLSVIAADLVVPSGTTRDIGSNESYDTVTLEGATVNLNAAQLKCQTVAATANSTIKFNGGKLASSSWDKIWFNPSSGATLTLESVEGNNIYLDVGYQRHNFSQGAGTVATAGSGDIVVNSLKDGNGTRMYLTFDNSNVSWGHSGDLRATGSGGLKVVNPGTLPHGASTGGIKLEGSTELLIADNAATDVNSIEGTVRSDGTAGSPSTIRFGNYKNGTFKNAPDVGGYCVVEKHGSGTTLTLDNTGFQKLDVKGGTVFASGGATAVNELNMEADATLNVSNTTFTATNSSVFNAFSSVAIGETGVFDVVGGTDASFKLESSGSFVKRGAGIWNVYGDNALTGRVHVAGGNLRLRYTVRCDGDQWWRMSITKQSGNPSVNPGELGLFAGSERINQGNLSVVSSKSASSLNAGEVMFPEGSPFAGTSANLSYLFDNGNSGLWAWAKGPSSPVVSEGDSSSWLTVVFRVNASQSGKIATSADVRDSYYESWSKGLKVESSPNGTEGTWTERGSWTWTGDAGWGQGWLAGGSHRQFTKNTRVVLDGIDVTEKSSRGIAAGTVVRVDLGATLDMSLVKTTENIVSALEFDATVGGGTITDAAFASHGTINIVNATRLQLGSIEVPLRLVNATDAANLANWTLMLNGVALRHYGIRYANGVLTFLPPGITLIFQ